MPAKPTKPRSTPSWADLNFDRNNLDQRYPLALPPERGARPGPPAEVTTPERGDPRNSRTPPMVDWTEEDQRALDDARRNNPTHDGRGVPKGAGKRHRPTKGLPPFRWPGGIRTPLWDLIDMLDWVDDMGKGPGTVPRVWWRAELKCTASPLTVPGYPRISHLGVRNGLVNAGDCGLGLQAWEGALPIGFEPDGSTFPAPVNATWITLERAEPPIDPNWPATWRYRYAQVWWMRFQAGDSAGPAGEPAFLDIPLTVSPFPMPDPNDERRRPPSPHPNPPAAGSPAPGAGGNPGTAPLPGLDGAPDLSENSQPWTFTQPGTQPVPPRGRTPDAPPGERERKFVSRTQRVGKALFNALDKVSEWAEIVDCIYGSLPKRTRDRWEKDRGMRWVKVPTMYKPEGQWMKTTTPGRRGLSVFETAGQYGLDGADWKSQAIYHNLPKVDMDAAVKCMLINHVEDQIIGGIQRRLPRNTGGALDQGNQALAELLNWVQEALGV